MGEIYRTDYSSGSSRPCANNYVLRCRPELIMDVLDLRSFVKIRFKTFKHYQLFSSDLNVYTEDFARTLLVNFQTSSARDFYFYFFF